MTEQRKQINVAGIDVLIALTGISKSDVKSIYIEPLLGSMTVRMVKGKGRPEYFDLE